MKPLDDLLIIWLDNPGLAVAFCSIGLAVAWRWVFLSRVRIVQKQDAPEPEALRRVVLDATARFPPRASDRRAS